MYDYGWRNFMPDIGRWTQVDPLLNDLKFSFDDTKVDEDDEDEVYSAIVTKLETGGGIYNTDNLNPYGYGYNNPISFDDLDGRCPSCSEGTPPQNTPDNSVAHFLMDFTPLDLITVGVISVTRGVFHMYPEQGNNAIHLDGTPVKITINDVIDLFTPSPSALKNGFQGKKKDPSLGNQFKDKSIKQMTKAMDKQVAKGKLIAKPSAPSNKAYQNTKSKYSYNVDPGATGKKGRKEKSHVDVNYPNPKPKNVPKKKKLDIKQ